MRGVRLAAGVLGAACAAGALGQAVTNDTVTYYWDVNDSGSNTVTIGPGETVTLTLWATWEPAEYLFGWAIYDIVGVENWETGTVSNRRNLLDSVGFGAGELAANNDILGIESFVLPLFFHDEFYPPPAAAYTLEWTPIDGAARVVRVTDTNHLFTRLWTDRFGSFVEYDAAPSEGATIYIIPAPAGVLGIAIGCLCRRRRR